MPETAVEQRRNRIAAALLLTVVAALVAQRVIYHAHYLSSVPFAVTAVGESANQIQQARAPQTLYQRFVAITLRPWPNPAMPVLAQLITVWLVVGLGLGWIRERWNTTTAALAAIPILADPTLAFYENKPLPVSLTAVALGCAVWASLRVAHGRTPLRLGILVLTLCVAAVATRDLARGPIGGYTALPEPAGERAFMAGFRFLGVPTLSLALGSWQPSANERPSAWHYFRLAEAEELGGSLGSALVYYQRATEMDPREPTFLVKQARLLSLLLFVEEARDALVKADALLPPRGALRERADDERERVERILARWRRAGARQQPWRVQPHRLVNHAP